MKKLSNDMDSWCKKFKKRKERKLHCSETTSRSYFVNISKASFSYCSLCSGVAEPSDSNLMNALEHVPNALLAHAAKASKEYTSTGSMMSS